MTKFAKNTVAELTFRKINLVVLVNTVNFWQFENFTEYFHKSVFR